MDCRKYNELIGLREDQGLPLLLEKAHVEHARACPKCSSLTAQIQQIEEGLKGLPQIKAPAQFTETLLTKLPPKRKAQAWLPKMRMMGATAALVLLLGSPLYMLTENPRPFVETTDARAQLEVLGSTVHIPSGVVVSGDLRVYNAELKVSGRVEGTVYLMGSGLSVNQGGEVVGNVKMLPNNWMERLRFGLQHMSQDVRSYVKGALR